jgi:hypothetical protein
MRMKLRIVTAWAFAMLGATVAPAQVRINLDDPKPAAPATGNPDPNQPAGKADAKKKDDKKKDEMGKIEGIEIARGSGFMGIQLVSGTFKLSFYNAKKKPVAPDVDRAALRWKVNYQSLPENTVLNPDGGTALTSAKIVKPPYSFPLYITLIKGEGSDATTEIFNLDFHQ